jgi:hypothetical protein
MPVQQNTFTHLRALSVPTGRGIFTVSTEVGKYRSQYVYVRMSVRYTCLASDE